MKFSLTTIAALLQMTAKAYGETLITVHSVPKGGSADVLCSDAAGQCCIGEGDVWGGLDNNGVTIIDTDSSCLGSLNNGTYTGCETTNGCDLTCSSDSCEVTVVTGDNATATAVSAANTTTTTTASATVAAVTKIDYLFPLVPGVGDTLQLLMSEMVDEFNVLNPDIEVNAIYSGNYRETIDKVMSRVDAGNPPAVAVVNVNRMVELNAKDAIIPLNDYIKEAGGSAFL